MTTPSRRAILAGAASLPIAAAPFAAIAASEPDPIFEVIEAHRAANIAYLAAADARDQADVENPPTAKIIVGYYEEGSFDRGADGRSLIWTPDPSGHKSPLHAESVEQIERNVPGDLPDIPARVAWMHARIAELKAEQQRLEAEGKDTLAGRLRAAEDEADEKERDWMWTLIWTEPTTIDGLAALMLYYLTNSMREIIHRDEWEEVQEYTIARALCRFAGRPTPPMNGIVAEEHANLLGENPELAGAAS